LDQFTSTLYFLRCQFLLEKDETQALIRAAVVDDAVTPATLPLSSSPPSNEPTRRTRIHWKQLPTRIYVREVHTDNLHPRTKLGSLSSCRRETGVMWRGPYVHVHTWGEKTEYWSVKECGTVAKRDDDVATRG